MDQTAGSSLQVASRDGEHTLTTARTNAFLDTKDELATSSCTFRPEARILSIHVRASHHKLVHNPAGSLVSSGLTLTRGCCTGVAHL